MTWDIGGDDSARPRPQDPMRLPGGAPRVPDDVQDELPPVSGSVVRDDGRDMPLIGGGAGQVATSGGRALEPSRPAVSLNALFGDVKRTGHWVVPEKTNAFLLFGDMMLDLREAQLQPGENRIEVFTVFGDVRVLVAPGVRVEAHGATLLGDARIELGSAPPEPGPYISLYVSGVFGDVKVKAFAPGEKPTKRWRWF